MTRMTAGRARQVRTALVATAGLALLMAITGGAASAAGGVDPSGGTAPAGAAVTQSWPVAGQNLSDTHYQAAETTISAGNVSQLTPQWTLTTAGDVTATPTVAGNTVYVPDMGGKLWAVNAGTGQVVWSNPVASYTGIAGDISRTSPAITGNELITGDGVDSSKLSAGARVFAVNRTTGALLWSVRVDSNPAAIITGSPAVYNGVAYVGISSYEEGLASQPGYQCCTFRGAVVALSATTGKILWKTYTVPSDNGGGDSNLPGYYAGGSVWGSAPAVDPGNGLLYVATGNNYAVPAGVCIKPHQTQCTRPVQQDRFDSVLALKLSTGAVAWGYRTIEGDVSTGACPNVCGPDYDFGSSPNLFTTTNPVTGSPERLVGAGQKSGIYWALHPSDGKLAWRTRIGPGGMGGGIEWGSAVGGARIYSAEADTGHTAYTLAGSGPYAGHTVTSGSWTALNPATGAIAWQTPDPQGAIDAGYVSAANGVVYAGSEATTGANMYALDASTGAILWSFASGGEVRSGAAIVSGRVYWGSGYRGGANDKLYAFGL